MIHICDSIMGSGKTMAAINYMNAHPNNKFIYITPYLDEAERIRNGCKNLHFVEPNKWSDGTYHSKVKHTAQLIKEGRNITSTHQAFKYYTPDMLDDIRNKNYCLIIDESIEVLDKYDLYYEDLKIAMDTGYVVEDGDTYSMTNKAYKRGVFSEFFRLLKTRKLIRLDDDGNSELGNDENIDEKSVYYYWVLPPSFIASFKEVFILTYMFESQSIHHLLAINNMQYERIGINKTPDGRFSFGEYPGYVPEYAKHMKDMIHILESPKLNAIGGGRYSLSVNSMKRYPEDVDKLRKNISNVVQNIWRDVPANKKMWSSFTAVKSDLSGNGYTRSFLPFNARAKNEFRNRKYLIYAVNIFMRTAEKLFYQRHGINVNEDMFALSTMVQWIWRSAIRDGDEIYIYIPSKRMRTLLINWMESLSDDENKIYIEPVYYEDIYGREWRSKLAQITDEDTDFDD